MLEDSNIVLELPEDTAKTADRINSFKDIVEQLIDKTAASKTPSNNESNIITCADCQNYEANLQKL